MNKYFSMNNLIKKISIINITNNLLYKKKSKDKNGNGINEYHEEKYYKIDKNRMRKYKSPHLSSSCPVPDIFFIKFDDKIT